MFHNILVAVDRSDSAWHALGEAIELAEAMRARLTIVTVVVPLPSYAYGASVAVATLEEEVEHEAELVLRRAVDSVPQSVPVTSILRHGHPTDEIMRVLREGDHDLVVVGSRDRSRTRANLFGSVAADLHYHAKVPVLIVHEDTPSAPDREQAMTLRAPE